MSACILIVDDESILRRLVERVLRDAGYAVRSARHADEALSLVHDQPIDVVVTDFMMPGMNGAELVDALRDQLGMDTPPCVLMSGTLDLVLPSQRRLFTALLQKPFTPRELLDAVELCLRMSPSRSRNKRSGTRLKAVVDAVLAHDEEKKSGGES